MHRTPLPYHLAVVLLLLLVGPSCLQGGQKSGALTACGEWANAGVQGGRPTHSTVIATLQPGDDLQSAIDRAPTSGGIISLTDGDYPITQTLRLKSHLVLRGTDRVATRLVLKLRARHPAQSIVAAPLAWTAGLLMRETEQAGLENLTIVYDPSVGPPPDPHQGLGAYVDDAGGIDDLHVVSVLLSGARNCWVSECFIDNAGSHPLVVANCSHVGITKVEIDGCYNRGRESGQLALISSRHVLLDKVRVRGINSVLVSGDRAKIDCRYNVMANSSFDVDMRLHNPGTQDNLFERCEIAVPPWMERTPLSPGDAKYQEAPPGPGNLLYLCTITRKYATGRRAFSMADDPDLVYEVIQTYARERSPSAEAYCDAPEQPSLWLKP